jgi:cytochrome c oxidase cbb3-type subunit 4
MHDTYSLLRHIADSWVLLALFGFFLGTILFAWRPGSRPLHEDAGQVPFRHEDRPLADESPAQPATRMVRVPACGQACANCTCDLIPEDLVPPGRRHLIQEA